MNRIIQTLIGISGALIGIFACAVAGVDFSAPSTKEISQIQTDSKTNAPANNSLLIPNGQSQLSMQIQQLQSQLAMCKAEASRLRMDAMINQMNEQSR